MVTIHDVTGWSAVPGVLFWACVLWAMSTSIFRGFWMREFHVGFNRRLGEMRKAQWELRNNRIAGDAMTASLTKEEIAERRKFLETPPSRWTRAYRYFLECTFCQVFWITFICAYVHTGAIESFLTGFGYAGMITLVQSHRERPRERANCPTCGGK